MSLSQMDALKLRQRNAKLAKYIKNQLTRIESTLNICNREVKNSSEDDSEDELLFNNLPPNNLANVTNISIVQSKHKHNISSEDDSEDKLIFNNMDICTPDSKRNNCQSNTEWNDNISSTKKTVIRKIIGKTQQLSAGIKQISIYGVKLSLSTETQIYAGKLCFICIIP